MDSERKKTHDYWRNYADLHDALDRMSWSYVWPQDAYAKKKPFLTAKDIVMLREMKVGL